MESNFTQAYRNVKNAVPSDSDSSDSDSGDDVWKRKSSRKRVAPKSPAKDTGTKLLLTTNDNVSCSTKKRKYNTVWCNVLQEQTVADDLVQFGLKPKPVSYQDRSCESYDFTLGALDPRKETPMEDEGAFSNSKDDCDDEIKLGDVNENSGHKNGTTQWWPKAPRENPEIVDKVAKKIIRVLNEPKHYIIYRVVKVIGSKKSLELLEETEKVEDNGGMFVLDNSRRRTPGGTFLQLLKKDKSVSNKKKSVIFDEDRRKAVGKIFKSKHPKKRRKKKGKKNIESMDVCGPADDKDAEEKETDEAKPETNEDNKEGIVEENSVPNSSNVTDVEDVKNVTDVEGVKEDSELEEGEISD